MNYTQRIEALLTQIFNVKGKAYISYDGDITTAPIKGDTLESVNSALFTSVDMFINRVNKRIEYIEDACDAASEYYGE